MREYSPKEIMKDGKGTGLYHYCCSSRDTIYAVGYCSPYVGCPNCTTEGHWPLKECLLCGGKGLVPSENPCPGHHSKDAACEHYRQYLLDKATFNYIDENTKHKCSICGAWTQQVAEIKGHLIWEYLCDEHCNRDGLSRIFKEIGVSWAS